MAAVRRFLIQLFIIGHLFAIFVWAFPVSLKLRSHLAGMVRPYLLMTGLWQGWEMFSPNPQSMNFSISAEVVFQDGKERRWTFPRMERMGLLRRYQKERYRKWREYVRQDAYSSIWPDTARFIVRLHRDPANQPVRIRLIREWRDIPPPTRETIARRRLYSHFAHHFTFFDYEVRPEDLL